MEKLAARHIAFMESPIGRIRLEATDTALTRVTWDPVSEPYPVSDEEPDGKPGKTDFPAPTPLLKEAIRQLNAYFQGERTEFDLPLAPEGSPFQKRVWQELQKIPYGHQISYAELARRTGSPKACRAVGSANGKNLIFIIIPCHRVVQSDGKIGGYAFGPQMKRFLLELENRKNLFFTGQALR